MLIVCAHNVYGLLWLLEKKRFQAVKPTSVVRTGVKRGMSKEIHVDRVFVSFIWNVECFVVLLFCLGLMVMVCDFVL